MAYNDDKFDATLPAAAASLAADARFTDLYRPESAPIFGGMGEVLKVFHTGWNLSLALKRPQPHLFTTERHKAGFVNECEVWINLGLHPHIVSCYYVREIGGVPSIFAEWMEGGSLKDLLDSGALYQGGADAALERVLDIAIQFARGLHFAHQQGLIHQDVKPANLLFSADGIAKVADFGIANALAGLKIVMDGSSAQYTVQTPAGAHTPAYCSPEQAAGKTLSRRTDIYSWAVSVLEMLLGARLWAHGNVVGLALDDYLGMDMQVAAPPALAELLRHCLKAEAEERPDGFKEIKSALLAIYQDVIGRPYGRPEARQSQDIASGLNNKALSLLDLDKPEEALRCWEQALMANPNHSESVYNRIVFLWHRGDLDDDAALRLFRMDFENHMGDPYSSLLAGKICLEMGDSYLTNGFLERASHIPEAKELLTKLPVIKGSYRCDYGLSRIVDYMTYLVQQQKFDELEAEIKDLYDRKEIKEALHRLNSITFNPELAEFAFAPQKMALNEALGRYGIIALVSATWPVRKLSAKLSRNLCFTADGKKIFTGYTLSDVKTGYIDLKYEGFNTTEPAHAVIDILGMLGQDVLFSAYSFNGKYIMITNKADHAIIVADAASGQPVQRLAGHTDDVMTLSFNADARYAVSGSTDGTVRLWRVADGECLRRYEVKDGAVQKVVLSHDGIRAAIMGANGIQVINLQTGAVLNKVQRQSNIIDFCVNTAFTQMVLACGSEGLKSYNLQTGKTTAHRDAVQAKENRGNPAAQCVCFLPNDNLVVAGSNRQIYFWNLETNRILNMIPCGSMVSRLVFNNDGRYLAAMTNKGAELWRCDYLYAFEAFGPFAEPARVHLEIFLMRYPNYSDIQIKLILMEELRDHGFGYISEDAVREKLKEMQQSFRPKEIGAMPRAQAKASSSAPPAQKKGGLFGLFKGKPKTPAPAVPQASAPKPVAPKMPPPAVLKATALKPKPQKQPAPLQLLRIYATARAEINLQDAQLIVMQAGIKHPILLDNAAPLVWCAAYPNEALGQIPLVQILMHYANQVDGEKYLNDDNQFIIAEGAYNGAESLVIAVLSK